MAPTKPCLHTKWRQQPDGSLRCEKCGVVGRFEWEGAVRVVVPQDEEVKTLDGVIQ